MTYTITVIKGDGIGPEIMGEALKVLDSTSNRFNFSLEYTDVPGGDEALKSCGDPLPKQSLDAFLSSDACLKGPVGETVMDLNKRLRFDFDLYANVRPARSYPGITPPALKPNIDITVIRENSEGFYRSLENEVVPGVWTTAGVFTKAGAERIARFTFRFAEEKSRIENLKPKVTLATKANIFRRSHGLYLEVFEHEAESHPRIEFEHMYADALCARLVRDPQNFDVVVSENLLADLLSDLAGQVAGGLGMTPGTNVNYETERAYFEPTHGSAPDIVNRGLANPIGQIRAAALMLEYLGMIRKDSSLREASILIEHCIGELLNSGDKSKLPKELGGECDAKRFGDSLTSAIQDHP